MARVDMPNRPEPGSRYSLVDEENQARNVQTRRGESTELDSNASGSNQAASENKSETSKNTGVGPNTSSK